jgi:hypothetical protein
VEAVDEAADSGKKATGLQGTEIRDVARMAKICCCRRYGDASKALTNDPATAGIAVAACTGWSQKNAGRRQQDVACAFLDIAELGLDEGCEALLVRWSALCAG